MPFICDDTPDLSIEMTTGTAEPTFEVPSTGLCLFSATI